MACFNIVSCFFSSRPPAGSCGHLPSGAESCGIHHVYTPPRHRRYGFPTSLFDTVVFASCSLTCVSLVSMTPFEAEMCRDRSHVSHNIVSLGQPDNHNQPATHGPDCACVCMCVFVCPDSKINERDQTPAQLPLLFPWRPAQAV